MRRIFRHRRHIAVGLTALLSALALGCGDDDAALPGPGGTTAYLRPGPYPVAVTTFDLADRKLAVFYPGVPGSEATAARAHYRQTDPLRVALIRNLARTRRGATASTWTIRCGPSMSCPPPMDVFRCFFSVTVSEDGAWSTRTCSRGSPRGDSSSPQPTTTSAISTPSPPTARSPIRTKIDRFCSTACTCCGKRTPSPAVF